MSSSVQGGAQAASVEVIHQQQAQPPVAAQEKEQKKSAETNVKIGELEELLDLMKKGQKSAAGTQAVIIKGLENRVKELTDALDVSNAKISGQQVRYQTERESRNQTRKLLVEEREGITAAIAGQSSIAEKKHRQIQQQMDQESEQFKQKLQAKEEGTYRLKQDIILFQEMQHSNLKLLKRVSEQEKSILGLQRNIKKTKQQLREIRGRIVAIEKEEAEISALFARCREEADRIKVRTEFVVGREVVVAQREIVYEQELKEAAELREENGKIKIQITTLKSAFAKLSQAKNASNAEKKAGDKEAQEKAQEKAREAQRSLVGGGIVLGDYAEEISPGRYYEDFKTLWLRDDYHGAFKVLKEYTKKHSKELREGVAAGLIDLQLDRMADVIGRSSDRVQLLHRESMYYRVLNVIADHMPPATKANILEALKPMTVKR